MNDETKETAAEVIETNEQPETTDAKADDKPKTKLEKAREAVGNLKEAMEKDAAAKGWDVAKADDFQDTPPPPKVRLLRRSRIGDAITAERIARKHFGAGKDDYEPTTQEIAIAKFSLLATFNGKHWPIPDIEALGEDFFTHVFVRFAKFLGL